MHVSVAWVGGIGLAPNCKLFNNGLQLLRNDPLGGFKLPLLRCIH